jgi:Zn-dependent protease
VFVLQLQEDPFLFFAVVLTVVISIVLHELAHGFAAIRRGDDTPIYLNRMTGNPLVHMGPFSLIALFIAGIAWGQMPIDPTRMRGKFAQAFVAFAGPATNLVLGAVALTALGLALRFNLLEGLEGAEVQDNAERFIWIFGSTNLILCLFNLFPVPPLDGSHILANFHDGYARLISDPQKQPIFFLGFILAFITARQLFGPVFNAASDYVVFIATAM